ncbi:MAG: valine--pyruvate transaminase [Gammaproteobacteria bacterium]
MNRRFSRFASRFAGPTGTRLLMDDLGEVVAAGDELINLGGGNPAVIPHMQAVFRERLRRAIDDGSFDRISAAYDGPQGHMPFLRAMRDLLRRHYGWPVEVENIAMTAGSQASFFSLFNLFTGPCLDGRERHLRLPLTPEYIGYADIAIDADALRSERPAIELLDEQQFKYKVDFGRFALTEDTGAVCVSRPTNPTGNVLDAEEMAELFRLTAAAGVPMIVDNAYGVPFPGIVFSEAEPVYAPHVIYTMSLSKLGLPGLRTGIVVADAEIIEALRSMNAIFTLATGSLGAALTTDLLVSGEVLELARNTVRPFYAERCAEAVAACRRHLAGLDYRLHRPEGAIFLWLWFPDLPIDAQLLYERLKQRGVLVIPGQYFFPGLAEPWHHRHECLRVSYAQPPAAVDAGMRIIAEEVRRVLAAD